MPQSTRRARSLAAVLKDALKRSGMSERAVAKQLDISNMTVNRWVNGETVPSVADVASFLTVIGVVGDERERFLSLASAPESDWLVSGPPGMNPQLATVLEYERDATRIIEWAPLTIPGLMQIPDYARSVISRGSPDLSRQELENMVMVRNHRREILTRRRDPVRLEAFIGLPAIHGGVGGHEVMQSQLEFLLDLAARDNITIQLYDLAGEWTPANLGQFIIFEAAGLPPTVYLEHHRSGSFLDGPSDVSAYQNVVEQVKEAAMSTDRTAELIADVIARSLETTG